MPLDIREKFVALLGSHFELQSLEESPVTVYGLLPDFTIAYVNPAWSRFAEDNDGQPAIANAWGVGSRYLDAIALPLRPFYQGLVERAAGRDQSLHPLTHQYECSSAQRFRKFSMQVYALPDRAGYLVINACVVDAPHDDSARPPAGAQFATYATADGQIVQCAHCRLVQRVAEPSRWDWLPDWVEQSPPGTSHGLCAMCLDYYYPAKAA